MPALTGLGLQYVLTDAENGTLNTQAVNCHRQFKVYGDVVWGARTLAGNDQAGSQWKYVPIRRSPSTSSPASTRAPNGSSSSPTTRPCGPDPDERRHLHAGAVPAGGVSGTTPAAGVLRQVRRREQSPRPASTQGVVNILVGFAPLYPAEFVVIQIQQIVAQAS